MAEKKDEQNSEQRPEGYPQREETSYRSARSHRGADSQRSALERLAADLLKKGFEAGRDTLRHTDERLKNVGESVFARDMTQYFASQMEDIRDAMTKSIAAEFGRFLRETNWASEMRRAFSGMTVEAKVQLSFRSDKEAEKASGDEVDVPDANKDVQRDG